MKYVEEVQKCVCNNICQFKSVFLNELKVICLGLKYIQFNPEPEFYRVGSGTETFENSDPKPDVWKSRIQSQTFL